MGVNTDAVLFYGYCWKEEDVDLFPDEEAEWPELILRKRGERNPWRDFPKEIEDLHPYAAQKAAGERWVKENETTIDAWRDKVKAVEEEFGVLLDTHCSGGCPMPYLSARACSASRGYPEEVTSLEVDPSWDGKLDRWLEEFGIEKPHDGPRWWLVSYWSE